MNYTITTVSSRQSTQMLSSFCFFVCFEAHKSKPADPWLHTQAQLKPLASSLQMTRLWLVSLVTLMRQTTVERWAAWPGDARTTVSSSMWTKQRSLLWTSEEHTPTMLVWTSAVPPWRRKGECGEYSNLGFKRTSVDFVLVVEHWTSSIPSTGCSKVHGSLHNQSTCVLWTWRRHSTLFPLASCWRCFWSIGHRALC